MSKKETSGSYFEQTFGKKNTKEPLSGEPGKASDARSSGRKEKPGGFREKEGGHGARKEGWKERPAKSGQANRDGSRHEKGNSEHKGDRKPFFAREDRNAGAGKKHSGPRERGENREHREGRENRPSAPVERQRSNDNQTIISRDNQVRNTKIGAHLNPRKSRFDEAEDPIDEQMAATPKAPEKMPLNKYIAHCGICSRRDAVEFIRQGKVKVNGELATEPGMKINDGDAVTVAGKKVLPNRNLTYILLNKPKGFITTTEDEKGRRTVMDLVSGADAQRLYPIGRLDRNTTGLIILTNDGELSQKLSHPKYNIKKIYQVTLDKPITKPDFDKILAGVTLEDGLAPVDSLAILEEKNELGIEIHSGKNRIVRRIFEHLGYQVEKLDRVMYAGLTKKNLPRGKWRLLTEREVILLKHFKPQ